MAFKMKGFSPFTKETRYEGPRGTGGDEKEKTMKKTLKKGTKPPDVEKLKEKLFNMENPNSAEGKKLQEQLMNLGVDLSSGNYDEIDQLWHLR